MGFQRGTERLRSLDVECFCESVRGGTEPCDPPAGYTGSVYPSSSTRNTIASTRNICTLYMEYTSNYKKYTRYMEYMVSTWNTLEDTFKHKYASYILKRALIP